MKLLIIGSTGKLGSKLSSYCHFHSINIKSATCYKNIKKLTAQKKQFNIKNIYKLSDQIEKNKFLDHISNSKFDVVYFLDFGSYSLTYIDILLKNNSSCLFAVANKEMLIAGGKLLQKKIIASKNKFLPLDSEHYSLRYLNLNNKHINKLYITASGGPFYFKKKINLKKVSLKQVISHPKWKMGINNSIDSSNFINKILEIFELSSIYGVDLRKIDFLVHKDALVHSIVIYNDNLISLNAFMNNMLIPLVSPLNDMNNLPNLKINNNFIFNINSFSLEKFNDQRFIIKKFLNKIKTFNHSTQIEFMLLNNLAQKKYMNGEINYQDIIGFIFSNISINKNKSNFKTISQILNFIKTTASAYDKNI